MKNYFLALIFGIFFSACGGGESSSSSFTSGVPGSMARFAIAGDYLYTITGEEMNVFDISEAASPQSLSKVRMNFDVETLFAYKEYLYVGSASGMYIYDTTIPTQPTKIADFTHARSCDPVIVVDDIAYITLNSSSTCFRDSFGINRLEIVDVSNPQSPQLIKQVDMWGPRGLAVDNNKLFVCDGEDGLKVFDINTSESNSTLSVELQLQETKKEINCYDLIAYDYTLSISNTTKIDQFDYAVTPMKKY